MLIYSTPQAAYYVYYMFTGHGNVLGEFGCDSVIST